MTGPLPADLTGRDQPAELRWLPDGKRLSYVYKDGFYTVPAN